MQTTNAGYAAERAWVDGSVGGSAEAPLSLTEAEHVVLERHKPILRFDRQYDYKAASVLGAVENRGNLLRTGHGELVGRAGDDPGLSLELLATYSKEFEASEDDCLCLAPDPLGDARSMEADPRYAGRLYGRVVRDKTDGRTWLQYWFWLYYNPKNLFGFGKHEGDWEMVQVGLGRDDQPEVATYAQHTGGEARAWRNVQVEQGRPVVYVASLSHASYFRGGTHPYPVGIDHAYGDGPPEDDLPVEPFGAWVDWTGRWGSSERATGRELGRGPRSPPPPRGQVGASGRLSRQGAGAQGTRPAAERHARRRLRDLPEAAAAPGAAAGRAAGRGRVGAGPASMATLAAPVPDGPRRRAGGREPHPTRARAGGSGEIEAAGAAGVARGVGEHVQPAAPAKRTDRRAGRRGERDGRRSPRQRRAITYRRAAGIPRDLGALAHLAVPAAKHGLVPSLTERSISVLAD
jgi:hypothetical protein